MAFVPFEGKLDDAPASSGGYVPFTGQLDSPAENKGLLSRAGDAVHGFLMGDYSSGIDKDASAAALAAIDNPPAQSSTPATAAPTPDQNRKVLQSNKAQSIAGIQKLYNLEGDDALQEYNRMLQAGESPDDVIRKGVPPSTFLGDVSEMHKAVARAGIHTAEFAAMGAAGLAHLAGGMSQDNSVRDALFGAVDQLKDYEQKYVAKSPDVSAPGQVFRTIGDVAGVVWQSMLLPAAKAAQAAEGAVTAKGVLAELLNSGFDAARVPGLVSAADTMQQVYEKTGDVAATAKAGTADFISQGVMFAGGAGAFDSEVARTLSSGVSMAATGDLARVIKNSGMPSDMQTDFSGEELGKNALLGAALHGAHEAKALLTGEVQPTAQDIQDYQDGVRSTYQGPFPQEATPEQRKASNDFYANYHQELLNKQNAAQAGDLSGETGRAAGSAPLDPMLQSHLDALNYARDSTLNGYETLPVLPESITGRAAAEAAQEQARQSALASAHAQEDLNNALGNANLSLDELNQFKVRANNAMSQAAKDAAARDVAWANHEAAQEKTKAKDFTRAEMQRDDQDMAALQATGEAAGYTGEDQPTTLATALAYAKVGESPRDTRIRQEKERMAAAKDARDAQKTQAQQLADNEAGHFSTARTAADEMREVRPESTKPPEVTPAPEASPEVKPEAAPETATPAEEPAGREITVSGKTADADFTHTTRA